MSTKKQEATAAAIGGVVASSAFEDALLESASLGDTEPVGGSRDPDVMLALTRAAMRVELGEANARIAQLEADARAQGEVVRSSVRTARELDKTMARVQELAAQWREDSQTYWADQLAQAIDSNDLYPGLLIPVGDAEPEKCKHGRSEEHWPDGDTEPYLCRPIGDAEPTKPTEACCDIHGRNCEPPSELCCDLCTEFHHGMHADPPKFNRTLSSHHDGSICSNPDLSRFGSVGGTEPELAHDFTIDGVMHAPYNDDGALYCGWSGDAGTFGGCGEAWPCSTVRARSASTEPTPEANK